MTGVAAIASARLDRRARPLRSAASADRPKGGQMKVLLLYPEFPNTFWSFKHALAFVDKSTGMPPLGLVTIAAMLPADWELRLFDMNVTPLRDADLAWADCVFISAMIVQR